MIQAGNFTIGRINTLCFFFSICLSKIINKLGNTTIVEITPKITPLAMTKPISRPNVNRMAHKAIKPAMVVIEEELIETKVA